MIDLPLPETLRWQDGLELLDQRHLPHRVDYLKIQSLDQAWHAIKNLSVRGAPAIGVAAGYALAQSMQNVGAGDFAKTLKNNGDYLKSARPTAVNLAWAVDRLVSLGENATPADLLDEARAIHNEDLAICAGLGEQGAHLIKPAAGVLTHCNAGSLAVSRLGTATAPMYVQHARGVPFKVYADETRPLYQGARLTAWELKQSGLDVTLICDNMAATTMAAGRIDMAIVGTDRVTANGDVVNKIGTLNVAILCQYFGLPFYVACPSSTFDPYTARGADVVIEEREPSEVLGDHGADVPVLNPAFDVTPAAMVTGIITEHGVHAPHELKALLSDPQ